MSGWVYLPYDILEIIFRYLEQENRTLVRSTKPIKVQQNDIFQFQLTCKNWDSLARQKIYKNVKIKHIQQLESFTNTLKNSDVGPLVEHIYLQRQLRETVTREKLILYVQCIASFCTFLRSLNMESGDFQGIWKIIKDEKLKGNFTQLQAIPFVKDKTNNHVLDYNCAVFSLQQTLRKLAVYNNDMSHDESKFSNFPNIDTVFFKLGSYSDVTIMNRYMKWLPSVTKIEVDFDNFKFYLNQVDTEFPIHVCAQVKQLSIKYLLCKNTIYNYLMEAFPNLRNLRLKVLINNYELSPISTNETVRFLEYLLCVPELLVSYIPVVNQNDVMLGLRCKNRKIKKLKVRYISIIPSDRNTSYLTVKTCPNVKDRTSIEVFYIDDIPSILPRIGLIEQPEKDLQYLEIDMGLELSAVKLIRQGLDYGITLSSMLEQCPHLRGICIRNTVLYMFGARLQVQSKIEIHDYITFCNSLIHSSFLSSLSSCVSYISRFRLKNCQFSDETTRSTREIGMSNTEFHTIVYDDDKRSSKEAYLKLTKAANNTISWYLVQDDYVKTCTQSDYENSLLNEEVLSLSIQCKNVYKVRMNLFKLNIIFEP